MKQKKKPRGGRQNIQITIYPKTGRGGGKATFRKKNNISLSDRSFFKQV